jgi:uncharacterized RDD family membrane protein YckC
VNGDRVSERNLRDGDLVAIGTARLLFREEMEESGAKVVPHPSAPRQVCPSCQSDYRKGDLFCKQCGTSLAPVAPARTVCTSCGTAVLLPARFCNACGHALKDGGPAGPDESVEGTRPRSRPEDAASGASGPPSDVGVVGRDGSVVDGSGGDGVPAASPAVSTGPEGESPKDPEPGPDRPDVPSPPRLSRASVDETPGRLASAPVAVLRATPAAAPALGPSPARAVQPSAPPAMIGPRPSPAIVPPRPEAVRRPEARPAIPGPSSVVPAGFGVRLAAGALDALVVGTAMAILAGPVFYYWYEHWWSHPPATPADVAFWPILVSLVLVPVVLALGALYYVYHWGVQGATPAQRLLGLVVQAEDGSEPIGVSRAAIRVLGYLLSAVLLGIGFLMIAFGGSGLHDRLAGTRVIRRGPRG